MLPPADFESATSTNSITPADQGTNIQYFADDCKKKLSEMNVPAENPIDTAKPLQNLKKQLRKKRLYAAALAALIVFVGVYNYFFRTMAVQLLPWQDGLIEIIGVKTYQPEDVVVDERDTETSESVTPSPTTAPYTAKHPD